MTALQIAEEVQADLARIAGHLAGHDAHHVGERLAEIIDALRLLQIHPLIGRPAADGWRELVIGRGSRGYVARYAYDAVSDTVRVTAVRAQREQGFREG